MARVIRSETPSPVVAIIGGGYSGVAVAAALLEIATFKGRIVICEPRARLGFGLAYGEARRGEILNTRVRDMSICASAPGDFLRWVEETRASLPVQRGVRDQGGVFAPRALFGAYVERRFEARRASRPDVDVAHVRATASAAAPLPERRVRIDFRDAAPLVADALVLATGFGAADRAPRFGIAPFADFLPDRATRRITIVGSSLTMVDVLLRLRRDGYGGRIDIVSRRGLLPLPQSIEATGRARAWTAQPGPGLARLMRRVRQAALAEAAAGGDWRDAVNGFRPHVSAHWRALSPEDRRRFFAHARPYWDAHRHRLPLDQHQRVLRELIAGEATLSPGAAAAEGGVVRIGRGRRLRRVEHPVVDCSGHRPDLAAPILRSVVSSGLATIDDIGIGLAVETDGRTQRIHAHGVVYAVGPLGVGSLAEITATPEIMAQAASAARGIVARLGDRQSS